MVRQPVHLTALIPWQASTSSKPVHRAHTFACNWQPFLNDSAEGRRMTVEIISWSKEQNWAVIFPTMWYVGPAKPQISLRIRAVWSEPLLVTWIFYDFKATARTAFGVSKFNRRLHRLVWVYTCQNATLLEITCRGWNWSVHFEIDTNTIWSDLRLFQMLNYGWESDVVCLVLLSCTSVYWCLVVTCWDRADLLALVCDVLLWSCHFPIGILDQMWCLIVSIPDLCPLSNFNC